MVTNFQKGPTAGGQGGPLFLRAATPGAPGTVRGALLCQRARPPADPARIFIVPLVPRGDQH